MAGIPVVIVESGGLPVTEAADNYGTPMEESASGIGLPVTFSDYGGLPVSGISSEGAGAIDGLSSFTWASTAADATPDFTFNLPAEAVAGDIIRVRYDGGTDYFTYALTAPDIVADEFTVAGLASLPDGTYSFDARREQGAEVSSWTTPAITVTINIAPDIVTLNPADGSAGHAITDNLTVTFDKAIEFGTGTIVIYKTDDTLVESFDVVTHAGTKLTIAGAVLTINPTSSLTASTGYYVQIAATAIENSDDIPFDGITSETGWNFTSASAGYEYKVDTYFAGASTTWTAPADIVGTAEVHLWGAGGASLTNAGAGGGGAYARGNTVAVTPSTGYAVVIGAGAAASNGGNSTFASTTVVAEGGKQPPGASGGLVANCVGDVKYAGGNGNALTGTQPSGTGAGDSEAGFNSGVNNLGGSRNGGPASVLNIGMGFGGGGRSTAGAGGAGGPGHGRIFYSVPRTVSFPFTALRHWGRTGSDTTSHSVSIPDAVEAGDQVLIFFAMDGASRTASATGYTAIGTATDAAQVSLSVLHRAADGSEGSSVVVTSSASEAASWAVAVVRGGGTPTCGTGGSSSGSTTPTSPAYSPAGGSQNFLWFSFIALDGNAVAAVTAIPTNFGNALIQPANNSAGAGGGVTGAVAERRQATATQSAAAWTSGSEQWAAIMVAVPPV